MTAISERYDRSAAEYLRYWAPVLHDAATALLDEVAPWVAAAGSGELRILDVGTGAGVLTLEALRRWLSATVVAADASTGMLEVARREAEGMGFNEGARLRFVHGPADKLPVDDRSVDLVVSSFVYQLVPDRRAALSEAFRVLRAGGRLALVTWIDRDEQFAPADEFDEAVFDLGIEEEDYPPEDASGDYKSSRAAEAQLRRVGFRGVTAREALLTYQWDPEAYFRYKVDYAERALFKSLDASTADRLRERAHERLARLGPTDFLWRAPIVYASGVRPR